jgi:hypothetical protein
MSRRQSSLSIFEIAADLMKSGGKSYAAFPVWANSAVNDVRFHPMPRREAYAAYRKLREWNRTRTAGKYGGSIGAACLRVFECLVFDFMNFKTGQLDPSYDAIARKTGYGRATIATALKRLKDLGALHWVRRCFRTTDARGAFRLEQDTNAYAILPPSQWRGYIEAPAPAMHPSEWGAAPPLPDVITQAVADYRTGGIDMMLRALRDDPGDKLAQALARLGSGLKGRAS